jgi:hypothetical protein
MRGIVAGIIVGTTSKGGPGKATPKGGNPMNTRMSFYHLVVCLVPAFLVAGCDQSVNIAGLAEKKLTGTYCDARVNHEQSCKAGDIVLTVKGREHLLCDWSWQIVYQPGSDEVRCVHRGELRRERQDAR